MILLESYVIAVPCAHTASLRRTCLFCSWWNVSPNAFKWQDLGNACPLSHESSPSRNTEFL